MASIISAGTTSGTALNMTADTSGQLQLATGASATTAVTIDTSQKVTTVGNTSLANSSGNVGIGGASIDAGEGKLNIASSTSPASLHLFYGANGDNYFTCGTSGIQVFRTGSTERMRIDSSGSFTMGSGGSSVNTGYIYVNGSTGTGYGPRILGQKDGSSKWVIGCQSVIVNDTSDSLMCRAGASGGVVLAATATSWSAYSDERMKDIIEPIDNAIEKVSSLRSVIGKYKDDEEGTRRSFLIAQDVQAVLPEAVDANDTEKLGVRYTEVIPLLVAAIKEQTQIINDLKARIETLEAK